MLTALFLVRRSCPEVFNKERVLKNFAKFRRKHLCKGFLFNKVVGQPAILSKETLRHRCFL